jgi:hypothetical protein
LPRADDHLLDLLIGNAARRAGARLVIHPVQPLANKPCANLHTVVCDMRSRFATTVLS